MTLNHSDANNTITLPCYGGREGTAEFEVIRNIDEVDKLCTEKSHIWFESIQGDARRAKVNGAVKRWKRDRTRIEIPVKCGMYECGTFDASDVANGRILRKLRDI
jgi:hypothetical protein